MTTAYVEIRSQKTRGTYPRSGPDTYVAVQIVPPGQQRLVALNRQVAARRGIIIEWIGEGYRQHTGPRSMLAKALAVARERAAAVNGLRA